MPLRFFLDHCVPRSIGAALEDEGAEVLRLRDHLPTDALDPAVIGRAQELGAVLVTLNGDFADLVAYPPDRYGGIIELQVRNRPEALPHIAAQLRRLVESRPGPDGYRGLLFLVEPHRVRLRG